MEGSYSIRLGPVSGRALRIPPIYSSSSSASLEESHWPQLCSQRSARRCNHRSPTVVSTHAGAIDLLKRGICAQASSRVDVPTLDGQAFPQLWSDLLNHSMFR